MRFAPNLTDPQVAALARQAVDLLDPDVGIDIAPEPGSDPYARGGYAVLTPGAADVPERLARPIGERLFFAGEHTSTTGFLGTVHGAIATGERAAEEASRALRQFENWSVSLS